jgi:hypothetical protein
VAVVVEAQDPCDGATILVVCWTREEALAVVRRFHVEHLTGMKITDGKGTLIPEIDL